MVPPEELRPRDGRRSTRFGPYLLSLVSHGPVTLRGTGDNFGHKVRTVRLGFVFEGELTVSAAEASHVLQPAAAALVLGWRPVDLVTPGAKLLEVDIAVDSTELRGSFEDETLLVWGPEAVLPSATAAALRELVNHPGVTEATRAETTRVVEQLVTAMATLPPVIRHVVQTEPLDRKAVRKYIRRQFADVELSPTTIAEHFGVSTRTLHRLFEPDKKTVSQLIGDERLAAALTALKNPRLDQTLEELATSCGYGSGLALRRAVLAATGKTPSDLRVKRR